MLVKIKAISSYQNSLPLDILINPEYISDVSCSYIDLFIRMSSGGEYIIHDPEWLSDACEASPVIKMIHQYFLDHQDMDLWADELYEKYGHLTETPDIPE